MDTMNDEHARYPGREDGSSTRNREPATPDKLSQKLRLVTLMPPATEQQTKRKRDSQTAKNSIENKKIRVLNMNQKQVLQSMSMRALSIATEHAL